MSRRYEVTFVIETDLENVGQQPWWPVIGEEPMPIDWLEYVLIREMETEENVLDVESEENTIHIVDMTPENQESQKPQLELVVNNDVE